MLAWIIGTLTRTCRCRHSRETHTHWNSYSYCGMSDCGCLRYRPGKARLTRQSYVLAV